MNEALRLVTRWRAQRTAICVPPALALCLRHGWSAARELTEIRLRGRKSTAVLPVHFVVSVGLRGGIHVVFAHLTFLFSVDPSTLLMITRSQKAMRLTPALHRKRSPLLLRAPEPINPSATEGAPWRPLRLPYRLVHGFGGPFHSQRRPGFCVGGNLGSRGSMVTCRGFGTVPPPGPTSLYSPGLLGFSPGFCIRFSEALDTKGSLRLKRRELSAHPLLTSLPLAI